MEWLGGSDAELEALYNRALSAGMESPEDYMEVSMARLDALRRRGPSQMETLRKAFQDTSELMEVSPTASVSCYAKLPWKDGNR